MIGRAQAPGRMPLPCCAPYAWPLQPQEWISIVEFQECILNKETSRLAEGVNPSELEYLLIMRIAKA